MTRAKKKSVPLSPKAVSKRIAGRVVVGLDQFPSGSLVIRFEDEGYLTIESSGDRIGIILHDAVAPPEEGVPRPSRRQLEYLEFIRRYMHRNGVSPAETDIQAHFQVSPPSVNQMIKTLERRGFITRDRDWFGKTVPRSIRVLWDG